MALEVTVFVIFRFSLVLCLNLGEKNVRISLFYILYCVLKKHILHIFHMQGIACIKLLKVRHK